MTKSQQRAKIRQVQDAACQCFGITRRALLSRSSRQPLAAYRLAAMAESKRHGDPSFAVIACEFRRTGHRSAARANDATIKRAFADSAFMDQVVKFRAEVAKLSP